MKNLLALLLVASTTALWAQFPGIPGTLGSTAVHKDSSIILGWATIVDVYRGNMQYDNPSLGLASIGSASAAYGVADGNIVSLGDSGVAILQFLHPIKDGAGFDFVVFENSLWNNYMEHAFVEISSDGGTFFRFPSICNFDSTTQITNGDFGDATKIHNLAGKYIAPYGTPFDISEINDNLLLDKQHITHIRIVDVIGSVNPTIASRDSEGKIINDPFPTPFPSSGFDLDAVGVINFSNGFSLETQKQNPFTIFPNPCSNQIQIQNIEADTHVKIVNLQGQVIQQSKILKGSNTLSLEAIPSGSYYIQIDNTWQQIIKL